MEYLAPLRTISIDGFVCLDGRRNGVPFSYHKKKARVMRDGVQLIVFLVLEVSYKSIVRCLSIPFFISLSHI